MSKARALPRAIMELRGLRSFDNLHKINIVLSALEADDLKSAARIIVQATSWMDW